MHWESQHLTFFKKLLFILEYLGCVWFSREVVKRENMWERIWEERKMWEIW